MNLCNIVSACNFFNNSKVEEKTGIKISDIKTERGFDRSLTSQSCKLSASRNFMVKQGNKRKVRRGYVRNNFDDKMSGSP